ncbi:MAG: type II toxin-antitoxin system VapC family toxin [Rhizobiaceae bacterium]|nr:type II toxin-antitoxin system VapC family toxin [Rhizobiaceae bacterium]
MFLDASAIIAILGDEADADRYIDKIEAGGRLFVSPLAACEAVIGLARKKSRAAAGSAAIPLGLIEQAQAIVDGFLSEIGAIDVAIDTEIRREAVSACARFGKAVGHPATLNLGDCFAYACARSAAVPLLFKGDDFPHTDIEAV